MNKHDKHMAKELQARGRATHGWAFRVDVNDEAAEIRAFLHGYAPCPEGYLGRYRLARAQLGLTSDWYEAYADAVHAMGKKWPEVLTEAEERIAEIHADDCSPRPHN
jgi:hypothetical protein